MGEAKRYGSAVAKAAKETEALVCPAEPDATVPNEKLADLAGRINEYRHAVELMGDGYDRRMHASQIAAIIEEQEELARELFSSGQAPPFHVIVSIEMRSAAGLSAGEMRTACDRTLAWRFWESAVWDPATAVVTRRRVSATAPRG